MTLLLPLNQGYRVPASRTAEGQKRLREYYEALGRFVDMFSRVEAAATLTLWHYAKTSPEIAKVIFAGTRVDLGSKFIKQIAAATNIAQDLQDDLADVLQQLGIILKVRNEVLHYGAEPESVASGRAIISDALKAKGQPSTFPISPTILDQLTADLQKIIGHLDIRHLGRTKGYTILGDPTFAPWRYKHPVATNTRSKKGRDPRK